MDLPANLDLFTLRLYSLVVETGSFTLAARRAGLTQSAVTRQIQRLEAALDIQLLDRTTRHVAPTPAGRFLDAHGKRILGDVSYSVRRLREEFAEASPSIRTGISHSIGLAHLPGIFFAFPRKHPEIQLRISQASSSDLLVALQEDQLDIAVMSKPGKLPSALRISHRFRDQFVFIAPPIEPLPEPQAVFKPEVTLRRLRQYPWLLLAGESGTALAVRRWLRAHDWSGKVAMELENFDIIANLVSLGLGVSLVPQRVLALYARQNRKIREFHSRPRYDREVVVIVRRDRRPSPHVQAFVDAILFRE